MKLLKRKHLVSRIKLEENGAFMANIVLLHIPVRGDIVHATVDAVRSPMDRTVLGRGPTTRVATFRVEGREVATQQDSEDWTLQVKELEDE